MAAETHDRRVRCIDSIAAAIVKTETSNNVTLLPAAYHSELSSDVLPTSGNNDLEH
jgi:hypothetical protein